MAAALLHLPPTTTAADAVSAETGQTVASDCKTGTLTLLEGLEHLLLADDRHQPRRSSLGVELLRGFPSAAGSVPAALRAGKTPEPKKTPRKVRLSLYGQVTSPYMVVCGSDAPFARPVCCLRMVTCSVGRGNLAGAGANLFHVVCDSGSSGHGDVQQRIVFRCRSVEERKEWFGAMEAAIGRAGRRQLRRGSDFALRVMPSLPE